jgi:hypothetical protein
MSLPGRKALCVSLMMVGKAILILLAKVLVMIFKITLHRLIGRISEGRVGVLTLGIRLMKV